MRFLWSSFLQLHRARSANGFGYNPIAYVEIDAWSRLMQLRLDPWEIEALRALDDAFIESTAKDT